MKTFYQVFMYLNLFVFFFYAINLIIAFFTDVEPDILNVIILPIFLAFYFLFKKRYTQLVEAEEEEKRKRNAQKPKKKRKKK